VCGNKSKKLEKSPGDVHYELMLIPAGKVESVSVVIIRKKITVFLKYFSINSIMLNLNNTQRLLVIVFFNAKVL